MNFLNRVKYEIKEGLWIGLRYLFALIVWIAPGYYVAQKLNVIVAQSLNGQRAFQFLAENDNWKKLEQLVKEKPGSIITSGQSGGTNTVTK